MTRWSVTQHTQTRRTYWKTHALARTHGTHTATPGGGGRAGTGRREGGPLTQSQNFLKNFLGVTDYITHSQNFFKNFTRAHDHIAIAI